MVIRVLVMMGEYIPILRRFDGEGTATLAALCNNEGNEALNKQI
jgi:hypothetical protein